VGELVGVGVTGAFVGASIGAGVVGTFVDASVGAGVTGDLDGDLLGLLERLSEGNLDG
jgi:hypothetical protein